ncbi:MAG: aldehyde dehydrogenase family protein, partial [Edwardsiella sp. (in: enterobacteria)]
MQLHDMGLFRQQALIDGVWCDADSGDVMTVINPASGDTLGSVPKMGAAETQRAIEAAAHALPGWRARTGKARAQILRRWFDLILAHQEDLARLMTL